MPKAKKRKPAKKRTYRRTSATTTTKYRYKKNPRRRKAAARRVKGAMASLFSGGNLMRTVVDSAKQTSGMLASQFFAKHATKLLGESSFDDTNWTWKNYLMGAVGGAVAGITANTIKPGAGKEVFKGSMSLLMYKLVVDEIGQRSDFIQNAFGEGNYLSDAYSPGEPYLGDDGEVYLMDATGNWQPTGMGETLAPPTDLGADDPYMNALGETQDPYARVFS